MVHTWQLSQWNSWTALSNDSISNSVLIVLLCDLSFHGNTAIEGYFIKIESFFYEIFKNS